MNKKSNSFIIENCVYYSMLKTGLEELMVMSNFTGESHVSMMLKQEKFFDIPNYAPVQICQVFIDIA